MSTSEVSGDSLLTSIGLMIRCVCDEQHETFGLKTPEIDGLGFSLDYPEISCDVMKGQRIINMF